LNPYTTVISGPAAHEATDLSARLSAWHDAMVAHERRLRLRVAGEACGDECPHADARILWPEAVATFGPRAQELRFLRARGQGGRPPLSTTDPGPALSLEAEYGASRRVASRADGPVPVAAASDRREDSAGR
jgi:hypothetical protein